MAISLEKHKAISLEKIAPSIENISFGITWKTNRPKMDIDISAFLCQIVNSSEGPKAKVLSDQHTLFFNNQKTVDGSFVSAGDNRGKDGEGEEFITGNLTKVDPRVDEINIVATIDDPKPGDNFGACQQGSIVVKDESSDKVLASLDFSSSDYTSETAIHIGTVSRTDRGWEFTATGSGGIKSFSEIAVEDYGYPA